MVLSTAFLLRAASWGHVLATRFWASWFFGSESKSFLNFASASGVIEAPGNGKVHPLTSFMISRVKANPNHSTPKHFFLG